MESSTPVASAAAKSRLHPLAVVALVSVVAFSGVGIAALLYNNSSASGNPSNSALPPGYASSTSTTNAAAPAPAAGSASPAPSASAPSSGAPPATRVAGAEPPGYSEGSATPSAPAASAPAVCHTCATVTALNQIKKEGEGTGLGAVGGGVLGGLLGNQFGHGNGKTAMTVAGAVGGAVAGNAVEKSARSSTTYEMTVRLSNGHTRKFTSEKPWPYAVGAPVRVVNNKVEPA